VKNIKTIYSLAKLTASEWIRLKFFHVILSLGILFMAFSHLLSSLTFSVQERLLYDFGLGALELGLIMIASLIGSHTIQREIDRKTMFLLLARPIPRSHVVIGSWGAIVILSLLFTAGFTVSLVLTAPGEVPYAGILVSALCSFQKSWVITSVAVAFGLMVRPIMAFVASICYWVLCYSVTDIEFFLKKMKLDFVIDLLNIFKKLLPEFYSYNWKSYFYTQNVPKVEEIIWVTCHNLAWTFIWLLIGALVFRRKEIV
jgi:ABC-type transport system involved in multi-copper enzyme maturation permease subunit